ncbi:MAG: hypothetical protein GY757_08335, partial [bacterium]|nr:hypothetical protein [bacterium]
MCGIFGVTVAKDSNLTATVVKKITRSLFLLSESRGKEASGFAVRNSETIMIYKQANMASTLVHSNVFNDAFNGLNNMDKSEIFAFIGHSRLV